MKEIKYGKYEIGTGFGCWASSDEPSSVQEGDVRVIGGKLMAVHRVKERLFASNEVWWTPANEKENTAQERRKWTDAL